MTCNRFQEIRCECEGHVWWIWWSVPPNYRLKRILNAHRHISEEIGCLHHDRIRRPLIGIQIKIKTSDPTNDTFWYYGLIIGSRSNDANTNWIIRNHPSRVEFNDNLMPVRWKRDSVIKILLEKLISILNCTNFSASFSHSWKGPRHIVAKQVWTCRLSSEPIANLNFMSYNFHSAAAALYKTHTWRPCTAMMILFILFLFYCRFYRLLKKGLIN